MNKQMTAKEYREHDEVRIDKLNRDCRKAINNCFDQLFELAKDLQKSSSEPIRINTPFGIFIFHPDMNFSYQFKE